MTDIEVRPEALKRLGQEVWQRAAHGDEVVANASGKVRGVWLGEAALDGALEAFTTAWRSQAHRLGQTVESLGDAITTAAGNYTHTDETAMPQTSDAGVDMTGYGRSRRPL